MSFPFHAVELATVLRVRKHLGEVKGPPVNGFDHECNSNMLTATKEETGFMKCRLHFMQSSW